MGNVRDFSTARPQTCLDSRVSIPAVADHQCCCCLCSSYFFMDVVKEPSAAGTLQLSASVVDPDVSVSVPAAQRSMICPIAYLGT